MARVEVRFLIPLREDETLGTGKLHPPFRWRLLQRTLEQRFRGFSRSTHTIEGVWIDPEGRRVPDRSKEYLVDVDEERLDELREVLREACRDFVQQCLRVVIRGEVEYLEGSLTDDDL